ncbi:cupin domain-containing protein [Planococcus shenhongbingii]|uniref:cupin domain-containing protein n=1 Tax=Planococcus shenhongbingii TaxID=3058398 RepID=UPI00262B70BF|nr:cupin domain-containing protein [Planococcus sp. N016]WKA56849.1 cupin domain-containing protein [Planococcus sp. N016]
MTTAHQTIFNPRNGQKMIFRTTAQDTNGAYLEIKTFNPPSDEKEPEHVHPRQESSVEVLSGTLHFSIGGRNHLVGPGEKVTIPPGVPHFFWNEGPQEVHSIQRFRPALTIDHFFKTYFALAHAQKLNSQGLPPLLILSRLALRYQNDIRITKPPWPIQKFLFLLMAPVSKLLIRSKRIK